MEIDFDEAGGDESFKLEDTSETIEEALTHAATASIDEALHQKILGLPAPKVSLASTSVKSIRMEQMLLLGKMDARRLMEKPGCTNHCHSYECNNYRMLIKLPWKIKGSYENKLGGGGSYHAAHASRHLESH